MTDIITSEVRAQLEQQVQQVVDRAAVVELVDRLGACLDEGRFDDMRSLLADDVTARTPGGTAEGVERVLAQASRNHDPGQGIQHAISNVLVDLDGDRATVRANLLLTFTDPDAEPEAVPPPGAPAGLVLPPPPRYRRGDVYRFDAVRTPAGWRLAAIETVPVWSSGSPPPRPPVDG